MSMQRANAQKSYENAVITARSEIWQDINSGKSGSASIAIMDGGEIIHTEGFGMASREKSIPVDPNTLFNIASISKLFTATSVMVLVDRNAVKLDKPITTYLPEYFMADSRYEYITVRMLLNHTSGIPGSCFANNFGFARNSNIFQDTLNNLSQSHLKYQPGGFAVYCNDGFDLAAMIVERSSGQKYIDFLTENIFEPLLLKHTGLTVGERPGETAAAYYDPATGKREPLQVASRFGAGGLASTAQDLCRLADTFSGCGIQIFSGAALEEMRKAHPSLFSGKLRNPDLSFGLGWDVTDVPQYRSEGIKVMGKGGGNPHYSSYLVTAPDQRLSVAVLETGSAGRAGNISMKVLNTILVQEKLLREELSVASFPMSQENMPPGLYAFDGYYVGGFGRLIRMAFDLRRNATTVFDVKNGKETVVASLSYHDGYFRNAGGDRSYFANVDGKDYYITCYNGMDTIAFQKLDKLDNPLTLKVNMDGKLWLQRNVKPFEGLSMASSHVVRSSTYELLPGYVQFSGIKRVETPDFAGMAGIPRDQTELTLFEKDGQNWVRNSERIYSPSEVACVLQGGENTVTINSAGYAEWLSTERDCILGFTKPAHARVIAFSSDATRVYDSSINDASMFIKQGSFIELAGQPGDVFRVTARFN